MGLILKVKVGEETSIGDNVIVRIIETGKDYAKLQIEAGLDKSILRDKLIHDLFKAKGYEYLGIDGKGKVIWGSGDGPNRILTTIDVFRELNEREIC